MSADTPDIPPHDPARLRTRPTLAETILAERGVPETHLMQHPNAAIIFQRKFDDKTKTKQWTTAERNFAKRFSDALYENFVLQEKAVRWYEQGIHAVITQGLGDSAYFQHVAALKQAASDNTSLIAIRSACITHAAFNELTQKGLSSGTYGKQDALKLIGTIIHSAIYAYGPNINSHNPTVEPQVGDWSPQLAINAIKSRPTRWVQEL